MLKSGFSVSTRCVVFVAFAAAAIGAPALATAAGPPPLHIAFVGDSMADGLWGAMFRRLGKDKCLADKVKLIRKAENGTGLTRLDKFDWVDEVGAIATDPGADLFVGSFGVNDRQSIVDVDKKRTEYGGPDFDGRYEGIVEDVLRTALSHGSMDCWGVLDIKTPLGTALDHETAVGTYYFVVPGSSATACIAQSVTPTVANISATAFPHG